MIALVMTIALSDVTAVIIGLVMKNYGKIMEVFQVFVSNISKSKI